MAFHERQQVAQEKWKNRRNSQHDKKRYPKIETVQLKYKSTALPCK